MATIYELQEQRKGIHEQAKAILDKADSEQRAMSTDERTQYDKMDADIESLTDQINKLNDDAKRRAKQQEREQAWKNSVVTPSRSQVTDTAIGGAKGGDSKEAIKSIFDHLKQETSMGATRQDALKQLIKSYNTREELNLVRLAARKFMESGAVSLPMQERAALQMDVDASGGTLVMPEEFVARLILGLDERVFMRSISTVLPMIQAESVGIPTLENDPADSDWTTELAVGSEDSTMSTGKRNLHPHPLGKLIKLSKTLMRRSAIPADSLVRDRLTFKFAVTEEKGFLTGNGSDQPLGVFTASSQGISTSRDVSTDNTTTELTADGLINAKYSLMSQYLASANLRWIFHRTAVRNIRKLKDGNGQYLWTAGLSGQPDTILEIPYEMSEFAPSTFTSQLYVGLIGDFQWYWIAESLRFELQRLDELYAATNQVGFIGRLEVDGMPVLEEAFARVQLA